MDGMIMQRVTERQSSGYIGISVLALFAVAIIAGQTRGDYKRPYSFDADLPTAIELGVLAEQDWATGASDAQQAIRKFRAVPIAIDFGIDILDHIDTSAGRSTGNETLL
jgi:hypothetical protein